MGRRPRGRPGISSLPRPPKRFNVAHTQGFEGNQQMEDRRRARVLRRWAARCPEQSEALNRAADRVNPSLTSHPISPASSRYMRRMRIRVISALWRLVYDA